MVIQERHSLLGDSWRIGASKPAGLYGELPPLPAHLPAKTASVPRSLRKHLTAD